MLNTSRQRELCHTVFQVCNLHDLHAVTSFDVRLVARNWKIMLPHNTPTWPASVRRSVVSLAYHVACCTVRNFDKDQGGTLSTEEMLEV